MRADSRLARPLRAQLGCAMAFRTGLPWLVLLTGCHTLPLRPGFYSINAGASDYPVMMSRVSPDRGRRIQAETSYDSRHGGGGFVVGNTAVYVETRRTLRSEIPASEKLRMQVRRKERWVQFEGATFIARNKSELAQEIVERSLLLRGSAHR